MPNASITTTTLVGPWTRAQLADAIKTAMGNAGWTFDSETNPASTTYDLRFRRTFNGSTFGTVYQNFSFRNLTGTSVLWNLSNTLGGGTLSSGFSYSAASADVTFIAINHAEVSGLIHKQSTVRGANICLRPQNKPAEWNENNYVYGFEFENSVNVRVPGQLSVLISGTPVLDSAFNAVNTQPNPFTGNFDVITKMGIKASNVWCGHFSSDVVSAATPAGIIGGDTLTDAVSGKIYLYIGAGLAVITSGA